MNATVREWQDKAVKNLESAHLESARGSAGNFDLICFLSQQGIEKLLKGALIARAVVPPKTHDLVQLHRMLTRVEPTWACDESELQWLSFAAVSFRYPGESADEPTAERAVDIARRTSEALIPLLGPLTD